MAHKSCEFLAPLANWPLSKQISDLAVTSTTGNSDSNSDTSLKGAGSDIDSEPPSPHSVTQAVNSSL